MHSLNLTTRSALVVHLRQTSPSNDRTGLTLRVAVRQVSSALSEGDELQLRYRGRVLSERIPHERVRSFPKLATAQSRRPLLTISCNSLPFWLQGQPKRTPRQC